MILIASEVLSGGDADRLLWGSRQGGLFTVKEAYEALDVIPTSSTWLGWERIWKLQVQQQIHMFLWLLCNEKLMTNVCRCTKRMMSSPLCVVCEEGAEETCLHAVRDCEAA